MMSLDKLVLVRFLNDTMIKPRDSAWFSFYGSEGNVVDVHDQDWYKEDTLGFKSMEQDDKIAFLTLPGSHMQIPMDQFRQILEKYLMIHHSI